MLSPLVSLLLDMPYLVWYLLFVILHGFFVPFFGIGVCVVGIMGFVWWGSYSTVYVPPPLCVFPLVLMMCIPTFFFCHVLYAYFFFHMYPSFFSSFPVVYFLSMLG